MGNLQSSPSRYHTAFNPIKFNFTSSSDIDEITIYDRFHEFVTKMSRHVFNGNATYDVSGVVKTLFPERPGKISINQTRFVDYGLSVKYYVNDIELPFVALNAVKRIGESTDCGTDILRILSSFSEYTIYAGYPFCVYILVGDDYAGFSSNNCVYGIKDVEAYFNANSETVYLLNEAGDYLLYPDNDYIVLKKGNELPVNIGCTPNNPFYVKWVNKKGGVDFWMFQINQEYKLNLSSVEKQRVFFNDNNTATGSHKVYKKSADYQITAGADNLTAEQYNALSMIPFSPDIQWYCEDLGKWVDLTIDKSETVHETNTPRKEIELTFSLPELQLQQL